MVEWDRLISCFRGARCWAPNIERSPTEAICDRHVHLTGRELGTKYARNPLSGFATARAVSTREQVGPNSQEFEMVREG